MLKPILVLTGDDCLSTILAILDNLKTVKRMLCTGKREKIFFD